MIDIFANIIFIALFIVFDFCFFFCLFSEKWFLVVMEMFISIYFGINKGFAVKLIKACLLFIVEGEFNIDMSANQLIGSLFFALFVLIASIWHFFVCAVISSEDRR